MFSKLVFEEKDAHYYHSIIYSIKERLTVLHHYDATMQGEISRMANKNNHSFASPSLRFVKNTAIPLKLDSLERDVERSHGRKPSSIHHEIK